MKFELVLYGRIQNGMVVWKWVVGYSGAGAWRILKHGGGSWLLIPSTLASWGLQLQQHAHCILRCTLTTFALPPKQQPLPPPALTAIWLQRPSMLGKGNKLNTRSAHMRVMEILAHHNRCGRRSKNEMLMRPPAQVICPPSAHCSLPILHDNAGGARLRVFRRSKGWIYPRLCESITDHSSF